MGQSVTWKNTYQWEAQIAPLSLGPSGGDSVEEWLKIARNVGNGNISDSRLVLSPTLLLSVRVLKNLLQIGQE